MEYRATRWAELQAVKATDPAGLLAIFRQLTGAKWLSQMPAGYGFERMIDDILEHEERRAQADAMCDITSGAC